MTIKFSFLNDQSKRPEVYVDKPDYDKFILQITTDVSTPEAVTSVKVKFPLKIIPVANVGKISPGAGWTANARGPFLELSRPDAVQLSAATPLVIDLANVRPADGATTTNDDLQVFLGSEAPAIKLFLMHYPAQAKDLKQAVTLELLRPNGDPGIVYRTPSTFDRIQNVLILRLTNKDKTADLVTAGWNGTPTIKLSFVYGNDIGSLTPADAAIGDKHSALNIKLKPSATYRNGAQTYEWTTTDPDPHETDVTPVWVLQPVAENPSVLGSGSGGTAEFRISGLSTAAPAGNTLVYLQYSNFPGYDDGYFTLPLTKAEPQPSIVYFDGAPIYVAALGDKVTLEWQTVQMAKVELQENGETLADTFDPAHGAYEANIDRTTQFGLLAYTRAEDVEPAHTAQWAAHVPDAQLTFSADKSTVADGSPVVLSWTTRFARAAEIRWSRNDKISLATIAGGSKTYYPRKPTTYSLHVTGQGDPTDISVPIFVLERGWSQRHTGISPFASQGPVLYGLDGSAAGLILVGGRSDNAILQSDDGNNWAQVDVAAFPARNDAGGGSLGGKLFIMGGTSGTRSFNDVWSSSDGIAWTLVTDGAQWPMRSAFGCVVFKGKLWVLGGLDQNLQPLGDVWSSSDGATWAPVTAAGARWSARSSPAMGVFRDRLWLFGGRPAAGTVAGDLWASDDGMTWTLIDPGDDMNAVPARERACLGALPGGLYLVGGMDASGAPFDDLNVFDGRSWNLDTGPGWKVTRPGMTQWRGALWFAGGLDGVADSDAVWSFFPG
jgi:hypothetical protein